MIFAVMTVSNEVESIQLTVSDTVEYHGLAWRNVSMLSSSGRRPAAHNRYPTLGALLLECHYGVTLSTRIKDAGIAIRHSRGYIISILQGPGMNFRVWNRCVSTQKTS